MQSLGAASPRTMSSARVWQVGAPQEPQSSPGKRAVSSSTVLIILRLSRKVFPSRKTGSYSTLSAQYMSFTSGLSERWFFDTGWYFESRFVLAAAM